MAANTSDFSITFDLGDLVGATQALTKSTLPAVHQAIGAIAQAAMANWSSAIMHAPGVWMEEKKQYVESLKWSYVSDFHARVSSDFALADAIEDGRPARDMKLMLNTSLKVRLSKKGSRYLYIPFRHNVPGSGALAPSMPASVYSVASQLAPSRITGMGKRLSGTGAWDPKTKAPAMVAARKYQWGQRLDSQHIPGLTDEQKRHMNTMYRFDTTGGGGVKHSTYLTFRTMSENSKGWIVPDKPGLHLIQGVVSQLQPIADEALQEAFSRELVG